MLAEVETGEATEEPQGSDEGSINNSKSMLNQFTPPTIYLVRTNKAGELSQADILPEDYQPIRKRLPLPLAVPPGVIQGMVSPPLRCFLKFH